MTKRGRRRSKPTNLPAHIDPEKVPAGIYWHTQRRFWYAKEVDDRGVRISVRVASSSAKLSELHTIAEARAGIDKSSLEWLCGQFAESSQFAALKPATQADYDYCRRVLVEFPTRAGPLGKLPAAKLTRPFVQRLVDKMADTPSKAAHVRRYLSRVWEWGANRGHVPAENPATGIDMPAEKKQRRLPGDEAWPAVIAFAKARGALGSGAEGAVAPYLWAVAEIAYECRLRGIEVITLTEANASADGVMSNRRKGSRDNLTRWSPHLREAWDALLAYRTKRWKARKLATPIRAEDRPLVVAQSGGRLSKSALDTAWQRLMRLAVEDGVIVEADRFGLHDLKRRGVTDTEGTRADKQEASGHRSASMMDVYDKSVPVVSGPKRRQKQAELSTEKSTANKNVLADEG